MVGARDEKNAGNDRTWCIVWRRNEEGRRRVSTHDKLGAEE